MNKSPIGAEPEMVLRRLEASEELYQEFVELSGLVLWIADARGRVVSVGLRWTDLTGADPSSGLGEGWLTFLHPDDRPSVVEQWTEAVRNRDRLIMHYRLRSEDGGYRWCEARMRKRHDVNEQPAVWFGTLEDVHEQHIIAQTNDRLQSALIQASRLNAMGALASVIAHDLNQPLTAAAHYIRGSRALLSDPATPTSEILVALDEADRNIVHGSEIVRRMRGFIAHGNVERKVERLADVLHEACEFALADATRRGITHRADFAADCKVLIDRVQVQQVVVNLLRNAVEAVSETKERRIEIRTDPIEGQRCEVSVSDTGAGIPEGVEDRLFAPFVTTRMDGMGLGLSICRMIVEAHGGTIAAEPRPGGGTIMRFTLPTRAADPGSPASAKGGRGVE